MEMIVRPCLRAKGTSSGSRSITPSSPAISTMAPAGRSPASRARSTAASVWPLRTRTPPERARSGKTWPGRTKSPGTALPPASILSVVARSAAEIPVVTPCSAEASTETVKAVFIDSVLCVTICGSSRRSSSSSSMGAQIRPRHSLIMKAMISGVAFSAAMTRSPSFSRSSSSTTTTGRPAAMSRTACSTGSSERSSRVRPCNQVGWAVIPWLLPERVSAYAATSRACPTGRGRRRRRR